MEVAVPRRVSVISQLDLVSPAHLSPRRGLLTLAIGFATYFMMPPSPTQTKKWFRPNGWFNEREETIIVSRVLRDDPSKGDMHNREGLTPKRLWTAVCDYDLWPLYILGLMFGIPISPPGTYLTLSLRNLGYVAVSHSGSRLKLIYIPSLQGLARSLRIS